MPEHPVTERSESEVVGRMRTDLIELSHRMPKGDSELPRLWNAAYDALMELQRRLEGCSS